MTAPLFFLNSDTAWRAVMPGGHSRAYDSNAEHALAMRLDQALLFDGVALLGELSDRGVDLLA